MTRKKHSTSSARKCPLPPISKPHQNYSKVPQAGYFNWDRNPFTPITLRTDKPMNILWVYRSKTSVFWERPGIPDLSILLSLGGDKFLWLDEMKIVSLTKDQGENLVQLKGMVDSLLLRNKKNNEQ